MVVVRDGDFAGVVAPTERLAGAGGRHQGRVAHPDRLPSSTTIYDHLKKTGIRLAAAAAAPVSVRRRRRHGRGGARTFDASYRIPYIAHVPLEPRSAVAEWTDGKLTVWTGTQRPFGVRAELAAAFRCPRIACA